MGNLLAAFHVRVALRGRLKLLPCAVLFLFFFLALHEMMLYGMRTSRLTMGRTIREVEKEGM